MDRFESICNYMHFSNSEGIATHNGPSKLFQTYAVLYHLNIKFQSLYISGTTTKTAEIVLSLVEPVLKKGHTLWMNNFYNSPVLTQRLKFLNIDCIGTLRLNRKDVPKTVREKKLKEK
jgi:hypothetical protein